ncbi:MAG: hypothetical protein U0V70_16915 [Terriglobia bacterium]
MRKTESTCKYRELDWLLIALTSGIVLGLIFQTRGSTTPILSPNDLSRWATIYSLAERGTYQIDITPWPPSIDRIQRDGHTYSTKPPLLPTLLTGEYLLLKKLSWGRLSFQDNPEMVIRLIVATVNLVPFILFVLIYARFLEEQALSLWVHLFSICTATLGTYLTAFCLTLNNHTVGAFSASFSLYGAYRIWMKGDRSAQAFLLTGLFAGFLAVNEFPAISFLTLLTVGLLWKAPSLTLRCFIPLAMLPVAAHFLTNYAATGTLMPAYADKQAYVFPGSYWKIDPQSGRLVGSRVDPATGTLSLTNPTMIDNQYEPWYIYLFHMLIGHHGIFTLSPIFIFSFLGIYRSWRGRDNDYRIFAGMTFLLTLLMLVFYTFFAGQRNYGGMSNGLRWLFWLIPFWLFFLPEGLRGCELNRSSRGWALACLLISAVSVFYATRNPWSRPWLHEWLFSKGWILY